MAKTIVITGATGTQGGSVVAAFLRDPSFNVRALTRDTESPAAQALREKGADVVAGDLMNEASLGANIIFAMTAGLTPQLIAAMIEKGSKSIAKEAYLIEQIQGRNVIHAAQTTLESLELFIFSSLSYAKKLSRGQYGHIYHFDGKAEAVESLQVTSPELARKTAVLQLGMFATNFREPLPLRPTKQPDGRYRILMPCTAETPIPFIDPNKDPAIFVKALATQPLPPPLSPDNSVRQFAGYATMTTAGEFTRLLNNHLPVEVYFEETSVDAWAGLVVFDREVGLGLAEMYKYCETVDYFGGQEGGTTIITELALEDSPTKMEDWVKAQDWSFLFK